MLFIIISEDEPDMGRISAKGIISLGIFMIFKMGFKRFVKSIIILLFKSTLIDMIMAKIVGKMSKVIFNPSLTPWIKLSNILTLLISP